MPLAQKKTTTQKQKAGRKFHTQRRSMVSKRWTEWWRETFHIWRCKRNSLFFVFFTATLSLFRRFSFLCTPPCILLFVCLSCGVKVTLCGLYHQQSRGVHLRLGAEEWRREESVLLFYSSLFVSFLSVSLFSQLNDVRTLNDSERGQTG